MSNINKFDKEIEKLADEAINLYENYYNVKISKSKEFDKKCDSYLKPKIVALCNNDPELFHQLWFKARASIAAKMIIKKG